MDSTLPPINPPKETHKDKFSDNQLKTDSQFGSEGREPTPILEIEN